MNYESREELRQHLLRDNQVRERIAIRAFQIYEMRGRTPNQEVHDWFRAEEEIISALMAEEAREVLEAEAAAVSALEDAVAPSLASVEIVQIPDPASAAEVPAKRAGAKKKAVSRTATKPATAAKAKASEAKTRSADAKKTVTSRKTSKQPAEDAPKPAAKARKPRRPAADPN